MKINRITDAIVNISLPIVAGTLIYFLGNTSAKNYLPDGLWAYAFTSTLLVIWSRKINFFWIAVVFLASVCFELLQYFHLVAGTGDVVDIIVYLLSVAAAISLNRRFKTLYSNKPNQLA